MLSQPSGVHNLSNAQVGRRHSKKAVRRSVLVQCDKCGVKGSGLTSGSRVYAVNLAAQRHGSAFLHACGGTLVAYDIAVDPA